MRRIASRTSRPMCNRHKYPKQATEFVIAVQVHPDMDGFTYTVDHDTFARAYRSTGPGTYVIAGAGLGRGDRRLRHSIGCMAHGLGPSVVRDMISGRPVSIARSPIARRGRRGPCRVTRRGETVALRGAPSISGACGSGSDKRISRQVSQSNGHAGSKTFPRRGAGIRAHIRRRTEVARVYRRKASRPGIPVEHSIGRSIAVFRS